MDLNVFFRKLVDTMRERSDGEQDNKSFWQPWLDDQDDSTKSASNSKQLPTTKWKRDRRGCRLPDYSRKTTETKLEIDEQHSSNAQESSLPLDMTVAKQRGQPPSYAQTISNPSFRSNYRSSSTAIQTREDLPPGISMVDPIIDEHFRRSLGKDYVSVFSNNNAKETQTKKISAGVDVIEQMDSSGSSVDDHFAKALGDTWLKLNKKEQELKTNNSGDKHSLVTI